jgi:2-polyprenyl-6-methoxyphenol hydroxylase-like FAD-dependent oxidoreductase
MPRITVLGAGVGGLATGMMLARDGHDVTILERDAGAVPESLEEAWEQWSRDGVSQFRQAHYLQPRGREALETTLRRRSTLPEQSGSTCLICSPR